MNPINLFDAKSQQLFWQGVDPSHLSGVPAPQIIGANEAYFTVRLCEMYLASARTLWRQVYPLVHCFANLNGTEQHVIAGPSEFSQLGDISLDRMMNLNQQLCGPLPYLGQDTELMIGLYAAPGHDSAGPLINMVGALTSLYPAGVLAYLPVASIVASGVESILGLDQLTLHLGVRDTFNAQSRPLMSGYWVGINAPAASIDHNQLWIVNGRLLKGKDLASAVTYSDHDYMVVCIERLEARSDWQQITEIAQALSKFSTVMADAIATADEKRARLAALWVPFIQELQDSPSLTDPDRARIASQVSADLLKRLDAQESANPFLPKAA